MHNKQILRNVLRFTSVDRKFAALASNRTMKIRITIFLLLVFVPHSAKSSDIPNMFDVKIGEQYPHKSIFDRSAQEKPRPTDQFKVPNSDKSKQIFPEYQLTVLRTTNKISVISATRTFATHGECEKNADVLKNWVKNEFPKLNNSESKNEFKSESENDFVEIYCFSNEGDRFPTLQHLVRGKVESGELKKAWEEYFN